MNASDKELLRHAVEECLVIRHPNALPASGILRRVMTQIDCQATIEDVESALAVLASMQPPLVTSVEDKLGSTMYWQATAAAILHVERGAR